MRRCRLISSQKEREFEGKDYNNIKKVYSILICMDSPSGNSYINHYKLEEKHLLHRYKGATENYDLPNIVVISLGKKADKDKLIHLLQVLFNERKRSFDSKKEVLEQEYGINMTPDMEKEMTTMCNLSLNISEEAMNEGLQKGIKIGEDSALNRTAIRLLTMGFSVADVAKGTGLSIETVEKLKESMEQKG